MNDQKPKLLYVDDEPFNLTLFKALFKKKFDLIVANSGEEGVQLFKDNPDVNVVISDMRMPNMDGVQFVKKIKKMKKETPCFILTGFNESNDLIDALNEQLIIKTFHKPLDKDHIEEYILAYLEENSN